MLSDCFFSNSMFGSELLIHWSSVISLSGPIKPCKPIFTTTLQYYDCYIIKPSKPIFTTTLHLVLLGFLLFNNKYFHLTRLNEKNRKHLLLFSKLMLENNFMILDLVNILICIASPIGAVILYTNSILGKIQHLNVIAST